MKSAKFGSVYFQLTVVLLICCGCSSTGELCVSIGTASQAYVENLKSKLNGRRINVTSFS